MQPADGRIVTLFGDHVPAGFRDRRHWILGDFRTVEDWCPFIEQRRQAPHHAGFCLAAFTQEDDVLAAENGVDDLWLYGTLVAHYSGEQWFCTG